MGCKEDKKVVKTEVVSFTKEGELSIYKGETDSLITRLDIEIASTSYETQTGLMYRNGMKDNQAMLFIFEEPAYHSFYMKNTRFSIDIIFIDDQLRIASFKERAKPMDENGLSSEVPVQYVLEVNAGLAETWQLEIGDRISYLESK
ncbi:MAG: DUF192 domain-containing protein [Flavobacteriaceae bacterium]|nr:DUF192 domain-containing protein [Flavobacteriaceae bacterium]